MYKDEDFLMSLNYDNKEDDTIILTYEELRYLKKKKITKENIDE